MATKNDYIEQLISPDKADLAEQSLSRISFDNRRGLHRFGSEKQRTVFGQLGQLMVAEHLGVDPRLYADDPDFDLIFNGLRLEVKTIACEFIPFPHYFATVNSFDLAGVHKQKADYYVFTRVKKDKSINWIVGCIPCDFFWLIGEFKPVGSEVAKTKFEKANATVAPISALYPISLLQETDVLVFPGTTQIFKKIACCNGV